MGSLEYDVGEIKYASATIRSSEKNEKVVIRSAKWELYEKPEDIILNNFFGNPESPDGCLINENVVSALIDTTTLQKGNYVLKFTVEIGPERIIDKCIIKVS